MPKTITLRVDDTTYDTIKRAADGDRRSMSNFVQNATINYIFDSMTVDPDDYEDDTAYLNAIPGMAEKINAARNAPKSERKPVPREWFNV